MCVLTHHPKFSSSFQVILAVELSVMPVISLMSTSGWLWPISDSVPMPWRMFIGATGSFTHQKCQIDIQFNNQGVLAPHHLLHICIGMSQGLLITEMQWMPGAGWVVGPAQGQVDVRNSGASNTPPAVVPALVPATNILINGVNVGLMGFPMTWFRQLQVRSINVHTPKPPSISLLHLYPPYVRGAWRRDGLWSYQATSILYIRTFTMGAKFRTGGRLNSYYQSSLDLYSYIHLISSTLIIVSSQLKFA